MRVLLISSSKPIPTDGDDDQPPHRQAANYYRDVTRIKSGDFVVTMEHPTKANPAPVVVKIDGLGPRLEKAMPAAAAAIIGTAAPRAGA